MPRSNINKICTEYNVYIEYTRFTMYIVCTLRLEKTYTSFSIRPLRDCRSFLRYPNTSKQSSSSASSKFASIAKYTPERPPPSLNEEEIEKLIPCNSFLIKVSWINTHLQCTTIGPAAGLVANLLPTTALTRLLNSSSALLKGQV